MGKFEVPYPSPPAFDRLHDDIMFCCMHDILATRSDIPPGTISLFLPPVRYEACS